MPRKERSDKESRKKNSITYPRQCDICGYVSNNPAMRSYHNKTHVPIPASQLCDHGCGQPAQFVNTRGKYTCKQIAQQCPEYIKNHAERIRAQWIGDLSRKEETRKSIITRLHNKETIEKMRATKRKRSGSMTPETAKAYRHYARYIRHLAQVWAKENGYVLGKQTYHVDHKLSIMDAWLASLPVEVVSHPVNLQVIDAKTNSSKGPKSLFAVDELMRLIEEAKAFS